MEHLALLLRRTIARRCGGTDAGCGELDAPGCVELTRWGAGNYRGRVRVTDGVHQATQGRVKRGRIRCSVRIWTHPHVKVGGRYPMDDGHVVVDSIDRIARKEITDDLARESGFENRKDLLEIATHGKGRNVYLTGSTTCPLARGTRDDGVDRRNRQSRSDEGAKDLSVLSRSSLNGSTSAIRDRDPQSAIRDPQSAISNLQCVGVCCAPAATRPQDQHPGEASHEHQAKRISGGRSWTERRIGASCVRAASRRTR